VRRASEEGERSGARRASGVSEQNERMRSKVGRGRGGRVRIECSGRIPTNDVRV
jgi:hypothetical protein